MEKVSIILPVYNNANTLEKCIDSVLKQSYTNFELIIINDGSNDGTKDIIQQFKEKDKRIKIIENETNKGVSFSRNKAIEIANGKYVTFIDGDDWIEVDAIEQMYKMITQKKVDALRTTYYSHSQDKTKLVEYDKNYNNKILNKQELPIFEREIVNNRQEAYLWLLIIKTSIAKKIKFNVNLGMMEDTIWYLEMLKIIKSIYFVNIPTYNYCYNLQSASRSVEKGRRNIENVLLIKNIYDNNIFKNKTELKSEYNTVLLEIIQENVYKLCFDSANCQIKKDFLKKLCYDSTFLKLIEECDLKKIRIDRRIIIWLLIRKSYKLVSIYCKIKSYMKNIK